MHYTVIPNLCDSYKVGHRTMYPKGMTHLQSNWTARGTRIPGVTKTVFFGLQAFLEKVMGAKFEEFLTRSSAWPGFDGLKMHQARVEGLLGQPFPVDHWRALARLGYVPLRFSALPEGTEVPLRVPMFLIENTHPDFAWLVNYIESVLSSEIWMPITTATQAVRFRRMLDGFAEKTSNTPAAVDWQGHDFSFRGMPGVDAASASGAAHLLAFAGSDCLTAMDWANFFYPNNLAIRHRVRFVGGSVPASEHSVMCAGGDLGERETFERILEEYPGGIVSVVSDTWDLWKVILEILPQLKDRILARKGGPAGPDSPGKLVIRPDSGDPVEILCGVERAGDMNSKYTTWTPAEKGVIELLWDVFGGTVNSKGYKVLDPHIGAIYGDAITYDRAEKICRRLEARGFASTNFVLGIGSYNYQHVTRDTFMMAMKATWCRVDGKGRDMQKTPVTDDRTKWSARGRLACARDEAGELVLINEASEAQEARSLYDVVWEDGVFRRRQSYREVAERLGLRKVLPE